MSIYHRICEIQNVVRQNVVSQVSFDNLISLIEKREQKCHNFCIYPINYIILVDVIINNWDLSIEFHESGKIELYGIDTSSSKNLEPQIFNSLEEFLPVFDKITE